MNLMPIANYLAKLNVGVVAKSLFINMIPINVKEGILLRNPLVGTRIDYEMRGRINTEFQVIVRVPDYVKGEVLMKKIFEALTIDNKTIDGYHITVCYPQFEPVVYPLSEGNLLEFSTDFQIVCHEV